MKGARATGEVFDDAQVVIFSIDRDAPRAPALVRVPVEGTIREADGEDLAVLLHVVDGSASDLELYRIDGKPILDPLEVERLQVVVNEAP